MNLEITLNVGEKNPYAKNPHVTKKGPPTQVTRGEVMYKQIDYISPFSPFHRIVKILSAIALTIFTAFIALAFETPKRLWIEGIQGQKTISVLKPFKPISKEHMPSKLLDLPPMTLEEKPTSLHEDSYPNKEIVSILKPFTPISKENTSPKILDDPKITLEEKSVPWHEDPYLKILAASLEELEKESLNYNMQNLTKQDVPDLFHLSFIYRVQASHSKHDKEQYKHFVNQSNECLEIALKLCHKVVFDFLSDLENKKQRFIEESMKMIRDISYEPMEKIKFHKLTSDFSEMVGELNAYSYLYRKGIKEIGLISSNQ